MTHEERKVKGIEILKQMDIYKPYIIGFEKKDQVCFFEMFGGFWVDQEPELYNKMKENEKADSDKVYFYQGTSRDTTGLSEDDLFSKIKPEQNFYFDEKGQLIITFNEYEVAPGYMGVVEFTIPDDVIRDILKQ